MSKKQEPTTLWSIISDDSRRALVKAHQIAVAREKFAEADKSFAKADDELTQWIAPNGMLYLEPRSVITQMIQDGSWR